MKRAYRFKYKFVVTHLPFLVALTAGMLFIAVKITGPDLSYLPGDLGDGRFNNYILEHNHRYFSGQLEKSYWDAPFMYPVEKTITFSDNLFGSAPVYSLFRVSGSDRETAYQLWLLAMFILNFTCSYIFFFQVFKSPFAAALGAFVFAFSIALFSQVTHVQTFPRFAIPLTFLMAFYFYKKLSPIYFFLCLFFLSFQIYCGIYLGFLLAIPLTIFLGLIILKQLRKNSILRRSFKWYGSMLIAIILNLILLIPLLWPYYKFAGEYGQYNTFSHVMSTIPTPVSWL